MTVKPRNFNPSPWQSHLLVASVTPICTGITAWYAVERWTADTRIGLLLSLVFAAAVWLAGAATPLAAITGGVLTATMVLAGNGSGGGEWFHSALLPLLSLSLLTFAATRLGRSEKERLGIAQDLHGRNAAQVVANLGIAGLAAALSLVLSIAGNPEHARFAFSLERPAQQLPALCATMLVASLAEATADTLSSELGEILGGEPFLITTRKRVAPGSDGAISLAGTLAGVAGAIVVVLVAVPTIGLAPRSAFIAAVSGIGGLFFDSLLGATAEGRGSLNNDAVNFLSTLAAALLALVLSRR